MLLQYEFILVVGGGVWRLGSRLPKSSVLCFYVKAAYQVLNLRINLPKINFQFRRWNLRRAASKGEKFPERRRHLSTTPNG